MSKGLAILTHAAQPKSTFDYRKAPRCQEIGCRKACCHLGEGQYTNHCYKHSTLEERQSYFNAWVPQK